MSNSAIEPNGNEDQQPQGHPAWTELLNDVPEDLRPLLEPKLQEWERNMSQKLQGTVEQYKPYEQYQPLVEHNVSLENVQKALWLAQQLEENPDGIIKSAIEHYGLGYVPADQIQNNGNPDPDDLDDLDDDSPLKGLENHPAFQEILNKARQIEEWQLQQQQSQEQEEQMDILSQTLEELHEQFDVEQPDGTKVPGFDDMYVTALMANGVDPEAAVKHFNETVNQRVQMYTGQNTQQDTPPVVMGGDGTTGSGIPNEPINMGAVKKSDLDQMVIDLIEQAKSQ